jgi:hypothetical protein
MDLFKSDLFRCFAVGFAIGAVAILSLFGVGHERASLSSQVVPSAEAAQVR